MKTITGALFLLLAEQAYSHANMIQFPNHIRASEVLVPVSMVALIVGIVFVVWGLWADGGLVASAGRSPEDKRAPDSAVETSK